MHQLVLRKYGDDAWNQILQIGNFDASEITKLDRHYHDATTLELAACIARIIGKPVNDVWEEYGRFLITFTMENGWDKVLHALGSTLKDFLDNMDALHFFIDQIVYSTRLKGPSFRCEISPKNTLLLHYHSKRVGLYPIVIGVVKEVADTIFNRNIEMRLVERKMAQLQIDEEGEGVISEKVVFEIKGDMESTHLSMTSLTPSDSVFTGVAQGKLELNLREFCITFPYHICFDTQLTIKHCGIFILKVFPLITMQDETCLTEIFDMDHPNIDMNFDNFATFNNSVFVFKLKGTFGSFRTNKVLRLRGQMILLENKESILYICSPYVTSVRELVERGVHLGDIPLYDATRDMVLLNQSRISQVETHKKLEFAMLEMAKMESAVRGEKDKADELLSELLPASISHNLKLGKSIEALEYDQSTILFSDVVKFTVLCSHCDPIQVIELLNDMYSRFDRLAVLNQVYKVETIGDAYMVAGGVPIVLADHAERIINQGLGMLYECKEVTSPLDTPISIRVGIYSGPVVAGVVGRKMPRYCLFGDTVNLAHGMEATGIPGRLQIGNSTFESLRAGVIEVVPRGPVQIMGKSIHAYMVGRNKAKTIWDIIGKPDDTIAGEDGYQMLYQTASALDTFQEVQKPETTHPSELSKMKNNFINNNEGVKNVHVCQIS